ncbi:uncharacterized protein LOC124443078 [Xenia sp. Carnegie-2017]|uniref:uncharacterized protein LOC124443078 n=1 Tax=Xenia sp. Carnegie-2017 TaxID=2897299 RepID=UPI001F04D95F|nr:uncharacterized protein LOC124443078 [Xenia sp. Carnegie-2017]
MHDTLFGSTDSSFSGYLKVEEGKNNWVEYWGTLRDNSILLYTDRTSEESGEKALKTIELSSDTRCELLQRRNYHFRFKLVVGDPSHLYKFKCTSAFHRQQWISRIVSASSKDRVIDFNDSGGTNERETDTQIIPTAPQLNRDDESLYNSHVDSGTTSLDRARQSFSHAKNPKEVVTKERRGSESLLRRLSFRTSKKLRKNSSTSSSVERSSSLKHKETQVDDVETTSVCSPMFSERSSDVIRVFENPAFAATPPSSPGVMRKTTV